MDNIKKPQTLDGDQPLSKALTILMDKRTAIFVVKDKKYIGLIDDRHLPRVSDSSNINCSNCVTKSPVLYDDSNTTDGLKAFLSGKYKALPVLNKKTKKLVGMVTKVELMKELMSEGLVPHGMVDSFMKKPVYSVDYYSTIGDAKREMRNKKIHKILVVDRGKPKSRAKSYNLSGLVTGVGKPRGIVSTFDLSTLIMKPKKRARVSVISQVENLDGKPISELIRERIYSVQIGTPLFEAMEVMTKRGVSNLLIKDKTQSIGILSSTDIFKKVKSSAKKKWNINISGLSREEDKRFHPLVLKSFEALAKKYSKNFKLGPINIHIKRKKSIYEAHVKLRIDGKSTSFSYNSPEVPYLTDYLIREIKKVLNKRKSKKSAPKRSRRGPDRR